MERRNNISGILAIFLTILLLWIQFSRDIHFIRHHVHTHEDNYKTTFNTIQDDCPFKIVQFSPFILQIKRTIYIPEKIYHYPDLIISSKRVLHIESHTRDPPIVLNDIPNQIIRIKPGITIYNAINNA